jgi:small subunit ribosomal protein S1
MFHQLQEVDLSFSTDDFAKALEQHDYQFQRGQVVRGKAFSYESDGALVDIGGKSAAFLPSDEASLRRFTNISDVVPLGQEQEFLIIREQDTEGQVTLSIRQLEIRQLWERFAEMQENSQTLQVRVSGVNKGGVTVDVQGVRGFIPRSHLIDKDNLESLIGKSLTTSILEVNPATRKLVLSNRLAAQAANMSQIAPGQLIEGKVSGIRPFGVFVDFSGMTGLLHINQVSKNYIASLNTLFEVGQPVKAVVIEVDEIKRRISLSTKVLENYPGEMLEKMQEVMAEAAERLKKPANVEPPADPQEPEQAAAQAPDIAPDSVTDSVT